MKKNINWLTYSLLMICSWLLSGQLTTAQDLPLRDSSAVIARNFNEAKLAELRSDSDLNYKSILEPANSLWDRFWNFVWRLFRQILSSDEGNATVTWGLRIFAVAVLGFFIWQLRKMHAAGVFSSAKSVGMTYSVLDEDIHSIDFEKEIAEAVNSGNHRFAVRMLYLQTLKKLSDSGRIDWRIDKTNLGYLGELRQAEFYPLFRKLTLQFENNWYGNIPITSEEYTGVENEFHSLHNQVR